MPLDEGELLTAERFCRWPVPCQVGSSRTRSTRRFPPLSIPMLDLLSPGPCWSWPSRMRIPLGRPVETKRSPLTPATVAIGDTRCWIAVTRSRPTIASLESAGLSAETARPRHGQHVDDRGREGELHLCLVRHAGHEQLGWPAAGVARTSAASAPMTARRDNGVASEASERLRTSADRDIRCQWRSGPACGRRRLRAPARFAVLRRDPLTADQQLVAGLESTESATKSALQSLAKPSPDRAKQARADIGKALTGVTATTRRHRRPSARSTRRRSARCSHRRGSLCVRQGRTSRAVVTPAPAPQDHRADEAALGDSACRSRRFASHAVNRNFDYLPQFANFSGLSATVGSEVAEVVIELRTARPPTPASRALSSTRRPGCRSPG